MEAAGAARPLADKFLRNILARGPSVHQVMRYDTTFKSERNRRECLALAKLLDAGIVRVAIDSTYPLADAQLAHERAAEGHLQGKIVLTVA